MIGAVLSASRSEFPVWAGAQLSVRLIFPKCAAVWCPGGVFLY